MYNFSGVPKIQSDQQEILEAQPRETFEKNASTHFQGREYNQPAINTTFQIQEISNNQLKRSPENLQNLPFAKRLKTGEGCRNISRGINPRVFIYEVQNHFGRCVSDTISRWIDKKDAIKYQ